MKKRAGRRFLFFPTFVQFSIKYFLYLLLPFPREKLKPGKPIGKPIVAIVLVRRSLLNLYRISMRVGT